ncbi:MAG: right-handed parallel beta-helix repeat-containing protein, partial [Tannerella sp.]|nr:right-handed parallel beta-helix repeat-containing protein [Tannerella sp.]
MVYIKQRWITLALLLITATSSQLHSVTYRVKTNGSDSGDGSNWTTQAMSNRKFAQALLAAQSGDIFQLAEGIYYPFYDASGNSPSNNRLRTFLIRQSVTVTGGFDANGNAVGNDYSRAVLSGNIGAADVTVDNVYNVVTFAGNSHGSSLKILTVADGYGNGDGNYSRGAGIFIREYSGTQADPTVLSHVRVANNRTYGDGCGIFIDRSAEVKIENSVIDNNTPTSASSVWGGGVSIRNYARVNVSGCVISNNGAVHGGGVHVLRATYNSRNSKYINNVSTSHGGALDVYLESAVSFNSDSILNNSSYLGGGVHNEANTQITAVNTVFRGNTAEMGGGFYNQGDCRAVYDDCIFDGNKAGERGGGIENRGKMEINRTRIVNNSFTSANVAWGGGINQNGGDLVIRQSEISNNTAKHGGGFHMENGRATVSNTTISGNTATSEGGAIDCYIGTLQLIYVTITNNASPSGSGSGIYAVARPALQNSIVSGNTGEDNVRGTLNNSGTDMSSTNIIGPNYYPVGNTTGTSVNFTASACLGSLAFNRSAGTRTHELLWPNNSLENPAVGRAVNIGDQDPAYAKDQTGKNRGNRPSLGAYEEDLLKAHDDLILTEKDTPGTVDISLNDAIPEACTPTYTLLPGMSVLQNGQFGSLSGTSVTYTPNTGARGTDTLYYRIQCGTQTEIARIIAIIAISDRPGNIKEEEVCMQDMLPINFDAQEKYRNTTVRLDGFSMPLVGDLNGDKKPEIVALGLGRTGSYTD